MDDEFAALQTDYTQPPASVQLQWLDADLNRANQNRTKVPFIVALSHRGLFSTSLHSTDPDVLSARGQLAPLFDKYAVDLVFNGHDHEYERSNPVKAGNPPTGDPIVGSGTTYVICAGAGADPYAIAQISKTYSLKQVAYGNATPYIGAYGVLTLESNMLTFNAYGLKASGTDDVIDTLTLTH
jgi:3',5'-cyclic AMP phosphodiesterase CpdA